MEGSIVQQAAQRLHEGIVEDLRAGLSYTQISFKHKVTITTVAKHARKAGLLRGGNRNKQAAPSKPAKEA
jgi:hypothetical protein